MKVLLVRLSSLGDIVMATAALQPLRAAGCELHFVTKTKFLPLLQGQPGVQSVYGYNPSGVGEAAARKALLAWIEEQKFNFILDLHDSLRTKWWRFLLQKKQKIYVLRKPRFYEFLVLILRLRSLGLGRGGRAKRIRKFTISVLQKENIFKKTSAHEPLTKLIVSHTNTNLSLPKGPYIVLVPGSAWPGKRWPQAYFVELASRIANYIPIVVLGDKTEEYCNEIAAAAKAIAPPSTTLHGKTNLQECMQVLSQAKLVVGNDTGLIHVAEALGKPCIVMEGPTHQALGFTAYRETTQVIEKDLWCRPCSKTGSFCWRGGSRICMRGISVDEVLQVLVKQGGLAL